MAKDSYRRTVQPQFISREYVGELVHGSTPYGEKDENVIRQSSMPLLHC